MGLRRYLRHYERAARRDCRSLGALLSLFGVIHSPAVGFAEGSSMMFVVAYLMMSGMFVLKHVLDSREAVTAPEQEPTKTT